MRMRDLARWPMENGSIIRICDDCASYEVIADEPVVPTSELPTHLALQNYLLEQGIPSKLVIDPVFLLTKEQWLRLAVAPKSGSPYILFYNLLNTAASVSFA